MQFRILQKSFIGSTLVEKGEIVDIDEETLAVDKKGKIDFKKHSALEPLDKAEAKAYTNAAKAAHKAEAEDGAPAKTSAQVDAEILAKKNAKAAAAEVEVEDDEDTEPSDDEKKQAIIDALEVLDENTEAHWTKAGKPDVNAVKEIVGFDVQRKDIDAIDADFARPQSE